MFQNSRLKSDKEVFINQSVFLFCDILTTNTFADIKYNSFNPDIRYGKLAWIVIPKERYNQLNFIKKIFFKLIKYLIEDFIILQVK